MVLLSPDMRGFGSRDNLHNMIRILCKRTGGLNICHINAQSLNNKIDEFRYIFENSGVDVICVSETWFHPEVHDSVLNLSGYRIFRSDRNTHGGGVAIFVRSAICCKVKYKNANDGENAMKLEFLFIEICNDGRKLLLGTAYRPHRNLDISNFIEHLSTLTLGYDNIILTGDFNANILTDKNLMLDMSAISLFLVNQTTPTHFTTYTNTLLDLFFVGNLSRALQYEQLSASVFSRHDLIFMSYDFSLQSTEETFMFRDFKNINLSLLETDVLNTPWDNIFLMPDVDDKATLLQNNIIQLYEKHVPIKICKMCPKKKPWFSSEIRNLIEQRNYAYHRWKRYKCDELKHAFQISRNIVNMKIREVKSRYYENKFRSVIGTKNKWKEIRELGIIRGKAVSENIDVDKLSSEFANIPMPKSNIDFYIDDNFPNTTYMSQFEFSNVTSFEVLKAFQTIKSNSTGYDDINPRFVKIILKYIIHHITHLFNSAITASKFPTTWKHAKIIPIQKNDKSYRPIAILPYLSKVFERLIHGQMSKQLFTNNLLCSRQSGFRPGHSCITTLIDVSEEIRSKLDKNMISILVLLDHSKAFDTVDHPILNFKLKNFFKYSNTAVKLLDSYLSNRTQSVYHDQRKSDVCSITRGVPQGSILGPLLYSMYANDLSKQINYSKIHVYADDVQIYLSCLPSDINYCISKINHDLNNIYKWATANGLSINPKKSKVILIGKTNTLIQPLSPILIGNSRIEAVQHARNLGIIFNEKLNWTNHINAVCGRTQAMLRNLWSTQYFTPLKIRMLLAKTYLIPTLLYGCELFLGLDSISKRKLNVTYNNIARYVYNRGRYSVISDFSRQIYDISLDNLLRCRALMLLHKIIYTEKPEYLFQKIHFSRSNRGKKINAIQYNKQISERHFFINSIRLWNQLPSHIQLLGNARQFKNAIFRRMA